MKQSLNFFLGKTNEQLIEELDHRHLALPLEETGIPHFDLGDWYAGGNKQRQLLVRIATWWRAYGFVSVGDPRIEATLLDELYDVAGEFFSLPNDVKIRYERDLENGFTPRYRERAAESDAPDDKEFYHVHGAHWEDDVFPEEVPAFETASRAWFEQMRMQAEIMLTIAAHAMGLPADLFIEQLNSKQTVLRLLHYFNDGVSPDLPLAGRHDDINFVTGLPPSRGRGEDGGLWCDAPDGGLIYVRNIPGVFRVIWNFGNMSAMRFFSVFRDIQHGVDRGETLERDSYSIPFFVHMGQQFPLVTIQSLQEALAFHTGRTVELFDGQISHDTVLLSKGDFFRYRLEAIDSKIERPSYSHVRPECFKISELRDRLGNEHCFSSEELARIPLFGRSDWLPGNYPLQLKRSLAHK